MGGALFTHDAAGCNSRSEERHDLVQASRSASAVRKKYASCEEDLLKGARMYFLRAEQKPQFAEWESASDQLQKKCSVCGSAFSTLAEYRYHFQSNHYCGMCSLAKVDPKLLHFIATFLGPSEVLDYSACSLPCALLCECKTLWPPWGKALFSRVNAYRVRASHARSVAIVSSNMLVDSSSKITEARRLVSTLVSGNRTSFLKIKKPTRVHQAIAFVLCSFVPNLEFRVRNLHLRERHAESYQRVKQDRLSPFRRLRRTILQTERDGNSGAVEALCIQMQYSDVDYSMILKSAGRVTQLRAFSHQKGLNSDRWSFVLAKWLCAFFDHWHAAVFSVESNQNITKRLAHAKHAQALHQKCLDSNSVWAGLTRRMQEERGTRQARARRFQLERQKRAIVAKKKLADAVDNLSAAGYPEQLGPWNLYQLLEECSGDWTKVLSYLEENYRMFKSNPRDERDSS